MYEFVPKIKSLKFKLENFDHHQIKVVDNGVFLGIVTGRSISVSALRDIFGTSDEDLIEGTR